MNTALEQLVKRDGKLGFLPSQSYLPEDETSFTRHIYIMQDHQKVMDIAKAHFIAHFAEQCRERRVFETEEEQIAGNVFGLFSGPVKKVLRMKSRFTGQWSEIDGQMYQALFDAANESCEDVRCMCCDLLRDKIVKYDYAADEFINRWIHAYIINRTFSIGSIWKDFHIGWGHFNSFLDTARGKKFPIFGFAKSSIETVSDIFRQMEISGLISGEKMRNPLYAEGVRIGAALVTDIDFFST